MEDLLTEQQQAEQVKSWLRQNGAFLAAGVVLGLGVLFGWNQWNQYQERRAVEASSAYDAFMQSVRTRNLAEAETGAATLTSEFPGSAYADQARLAVARLYLDQGKGEQAAVSLQAVVNGASSDEFRNIARLRLARVLTYLEKYDDALKALPDPGSTAFAPPFHDVRGDVYYAMGKSAEARSEYEQALNGAKESNVINREYVQAKLDDLGGAAADLVGKTTPAP